MKKYSFNIIFEKILKQFIQEILISLTTRNRKIIISLNHNFIFLNIKNKENCFRNKLKKFLI